MPAARARAYYEQNSNEWAALYDRLRSAAPNARVLLRGATVITIDGSCGRGA